MLPGDDGLSLFRKVRAESQCRSSAHRACEDCRSHCRAQMGADTTLPAFNPREVACQVGRINAVCCAPSAPNAQLPPTAPPPRLSGMADRFQAAGARTPGGSRVCDDQRRIACLRTFCSGQPLLSRDSLPRSHPGRNGRAPSNAASSAGQPPPAQDRNRSADSTMSTTVRPAATCSAPGGSATIPTNGSIMKRFRVSPSRVSAAIAALVVASITP